MNLKSSRSARRSNSALANRQRFQKILTILLASTDRHSSELNRLRGFVRNFDLKRMYEWAESVTTAVYDTATQHYVANQLAALILKAPFGWKDFDFEMNPRERAIKKFVDAEERCRKTNNRFYRVVSRMNNPILNQEQSWYDRKIVGMKEFIRRVLGESPDLDAIFEQAGYGPGASVGVHGDATNIFRKFSAERWTVSHSCVPYARAAVMRNFSLFEALCEERNGFVCYDLDVAQARFNEKLAYEPSNLVSFVPKTAKTERSIAVEPLLNSFVQKGIDSEMRRLLRRFGYDLSDQGRNSKMAKIGSEDGSLFTLDLSSASDTVSTALCRALLPEDWYAMLNRTRSATYKLRGRVEPYHKFASMGNGFCFPLETLIFAAAVRVTLPGDDRRHTVYGDDIIAPTDSYDELVRLLRFCGFTPNEAKSFKEGPFRESCGADWHRGQDVRPVYLDYPLTSTGEIMIFHNATLRSERVEDFFSEVRPYLRSLVPERERFERPFSNRRETDTGWWGRNRTDRLRVQNLNGAFDVERDTFMASRHARWNIDEQRWSWKEFVFQPLKDDPFKGQPSSPVYARAQYWSFLLGSPGGDLYLRRKTKRLVVVR